MKIIKECKMLEVEVKAPIKDYKKFMKKLEEINAKFIKDEIQKDVYFNHPVRNFAETDEALRVRQIGDKFYITYKGKKIDKETKTRNEFESICDEKIFNILKSLDFKIVAEVEKHRKYYKYKDFEICVDRVYNLGNFIEIESHNLNDREEIFKLLEIFDIKKEETIRESYLELILRRK